jgi:hypothetical protein
VERGAVRGGHGPRGRSHVVAVLGQHDGAGPGPGRRPPTSDVEPARSAVLPP